MLDPGIDLMARIEEDDGLVAGLSPDAAEVVREWCRRRVNAMVTTPGPEDVYVRADRVVASARMLTDIVRALLEQGPSAWLSARLSKVVPDGDAAMRILLQPRPLAERLGEVLDLLP